MSKRKLTDQGNERLGMLAHEMCNLLNVATLSFESIKTGRIARGGSTALVLTRALLGLQNLIDRSMAEVRLEAGVEHMERISVAEFIEEIKIGAIIQAAACLREKRRTFFVLSNSGAPIAAVPVSVSTFRRKRPRRTRAKSSSGTSWEKAAFSR